GRGAVDQHVALRRSDEQRRDAAGAHVPGIAMHAQRRGRIVPARLVGAGRGWRRGGDGRGGRGGGRRGAGVVGPAVRAGGQQQAGGEEGGGAERHVVISS